jgi:hypothetical protein
MAIALISLVPWLVIMVFAIVPKRFNLGEMVFLYFVSSILSVTIFSILVVNLHWIPASNGVEKALALDICRFVEIPLLLISIAKSLIDRQKGKFIIYTSPHRLACSGSNSLPSDFLEII